MVAADRLLRSSVAQLIGRGKSAERTRPARSVVARVAFDESACRAVLSPLHASGAGMAFVAHTSLR